MRGISHRLITLILLATLASCGSGMLETAYRRNSPELLDEYFQRWRSASVPVSERELRGMDSVERAVYAIYETLFSDFHYSLIARDSLPARYRYRVVQGSISYTMDDPSVLGGIRKGSVEDFRPRVREGSTPLLYLTPKRKAELDTFLDRDKKERYKFFGDFMYVLRNHWGLGWHIPMPPVIGGIQFYMGLQSAHIMFIVGFEGGEADLFLRDGVWIMRDAMIDSIE